MDRLGETHTLFGTAETGVSGAHGPGTGSHLAIENRRAVGVGLRTLAAEFVQAPALAMTFITELDRETNR